MQDFKALTLVLDSEQITSDFINKQVNEWILFQASELLVGQPVLQSLWAVVLPQRLLNKG